MCPSSVRRLQDIQACRGAQSTDDGLGSTVLAFQPRCDREVRCKTGAAPATVSGEPTASATGSGPVGREREGAAGDDPEPGDLRIAASRMGANGTVPRAEEEPLSLPDPAGRLPVLTLVL